MCHGDFSAVASSPVVIKAEREAKLTLSGDSAQTEPLGIKVDLIFERSLRSDLRAFEPQVD